MCVSVIYQNKRDHLKTGWVESWRETTMGKDTWLVHGQAGFNPQHYRGCPERRQECMFPDHKAKNKTWALPRLEKNLKQVLQFCLPGSKIAEEPTSSLQLPAATTAEGDAPTEVSPETAKTGASFFHCSLPKNRGTCWWSQEEKYHLIEGCKRPSNN